MIEKTIKIGSRGSALAKAQVNEVCALLREKGIQADFDKVTYTTQGDKDKTTALAINKQDDFFTDTLDAAILGHDIDVAVHSAKDLPQKLRKGLSLFALTVSLDDTDAFVGRKSISKLPPGAKIGTSSEFRQRAVKELRADADVVDIRGTIEERLQLIEQGVCDGIIVATVALKRLGLDSLIKDIMPWEAAALQGQLAVVGREDDTALKELFSSIDIRRHYGCVYLVGAGPGDPDLITIKGVQALKAAQCIFYDYLTNKELLNWAPQAEKIYVGKRKGEHTLKQEELSKMIRLKAMQGKRVVRLKGGDPLIFGRGAEEIAYLRSYHIPVSVIPGVSSATAIPSSLGIPLTARDISSSVAFISGHGQGESGAALKPVEIPNVETIVFLMGLTKLAVILESLAAAGWTAQTPILIVSKGTCEGEVVLAGTLETIEQKVSEQRPEPPALIIVGETVKFWDEGQYRRGITLYTGTNPQQFKLLGKILHLPMIHLQQAALKPAIVNRLIDDLDQCDMVIFTSRFAVTSFFHILDGRHDDLHRLREKDFIVIGKNTAQALRQYHLEPALISSIETSEGLLEAIVNRYDVRGKRILFPRSSLPNPLLHDALTKKGARVDQVAVYQNTKPPKRALPQEGIERIVFTSPSTVQNFLKDYGAIPGHWKIISKGPRTSRALREAGYSAIDEGRIYLCPDSDV